MSDEGEKAKVATEGSARVLSEVKGRLEKIDVGEMPVIERVDADGTTRRVDPTGEIIRPDSTQMDAMHEAAEAFAREHRANAAAAKDPAPRPMGPAPEPAEPTTQSPQGLWARIMAWFRRS